MGQFRLFELAWTFRWGDGNKCEWLNVSKRMDVRSEDRLTATGCPTPFAAPLGQAELVDLFRHGMSRTRVSRYLISALDENHPQSCALRSIGFWFLCAQINRVL